MKKILFIGFVCVFSIIFWGCDEQEAIPPTAMNISEPSVYTKLIKEERFKSFVSMVEKADLERWLNDEKNITVFAPTNEAIKPLLQDKEIMSKMIADPDYVIKGVRNHVIPKELTFNKLKKTEGIFNTNEEEITVIGGETRVMLNGKIEVQNDPIQAGNGVIYPITGVLMEK